MKKSHLFVTLIILSICLIFPLSPVCRGFAGQKVRNLRYGTTSSASGGYALAVAEANLMNKAVKECRLTVIETGASIENSWLLLRKEIDLGIVTADVAARAYHGMREFEGKANPDLRVLWTHVRVPHTIFVTRESGVKSIYELEGKPFGAGMTGSATEAMTISFFDACHIVPKWFRGGIAASRDAVKNRQIIGYTVSKAPDPTVQDVAAVLSIRLLPITEDDFLKAQGKYPGMFVRGRVPANAYGKGTPARDIMSYSVVSHDVATRDLPVGLAYKLAKAMYDNRMKLAERLPPLKGTLPYYPSSTIETSTIPLHAGVVKLCRELGVQVPADLIPPEY
ncbi:MAG: TAXI family TRAP transporter solute-binding subunit [Deltaproteobacteria bacterium]|nr:TAXI family TRAP transporter solute-binding subunit [Deltaproteobacteria bacterium]